jgi:hypothetical protein
LKDFFYFYFFVGILNDFGIGFLKRGSVTGRDLDARIVKEQLNF